MDERQIRFHVSEISILVNKLYRNIKKYTKVYKDLTLILIARRFRLFHQKVYFPFSTLPIPTRINDLEDPFNKNLAKCFQNYYLIKKQLKKYIEKKNL